MNPIKDVHIGHEIERRIAELHMTKKSFAEQLGMADQNLKRSILDKPNIDTKDLKKISEILCFNFFTLYCDTSDFTKIDLGSSTTSLSEHGSEISLLKLVLAEKERLIQYLLKELEKTK